MTIDKELALVELSHNEDMFYSILDTFLWQSVDRVVEKVALSLAYDYYQKGIDFLNGIIGSSQFIQAHYVYEASKKLREAMKRNDK